VLLPVLAWLRGRVAGQPAFLYSSVALVKGISAVSQSHAGKILRRLRWLVLGLLILGLARPQMGLGEQKIRASGVDIVVALDLSGSMLSEDFELQGKRANRLAIAKDVLKEFISKRGSDRIGLVAFAGRPYVVSPPTLDHEFVLNHIDRLDIGTVEDGTAIGAALAAALNRLGDLESKSRIVILMTDGQNNAGKIPPLTAAEAAETLGVRVYTIGVGTRGQAPMPVRDAFGNRRYQMVDVDIDEDTLRKIAERTGGEYFRADSSRTLRDIYTQIDKLERTTVEAKRFQAYRELFPYLVLPAWVLLMVGTIVSNTVWRKLP
jgi:Ca-activated chloride channel family protein